MVWLPTNQPIAISEGMRRIDGRFKRARIQTMILNGEPYAERWTPLPTRFTLTLNKSGIPAAYLASEYGVWVDDMKNYIEQCIIGLRFDPSPVVLDIDFAFRSLGGNTLAQAGPGDGTWNPLAYLFDLRLDASNARATVYHGTMTFNTDYYQVNPTQPYYINWKRSFFHVAIHECMHVCGVGSLWNGPFRIVTAFPFVVTLPSLFAYNVVGTGNPANAVFTAPTALAAWRETMVGQAGASNIPIENYLMGNTTIMSDAGGTALAHWRENPGGGGLTGIRDTRGRDLAHENMTGWSSSDQDEDAWTGKFTLGSLFDIGWDVSYLPLELDIWQYKTVHLTRDGETRIPPEVLPYDFQPPPVAQTSGS
jgi:hypothetical protein